ncbi:EtfB3 [Desulforapulum autotrophicum HRM2]|uniref:EtfB3 n=1 Tax=Desulforapulum autotrophicum (strain ATCC 43914 / DSM 3382 / VKM B-1955 / HRM2) TaxID=177437 RepID=C0QAX0_DESAH|nr:electron transfer flavoprotein subunit beta/FixA family protein [Desulforapulum autotrophicum]ACN16903.1 EtfB3 [Desulforapulum autotrophicum HRM2]
MEIIVLMKQVPATESFIEIAQDGKSIKTDNLNWVINPYDEIALEEAIRIKEAHGGNVTVITIGQAGAQDAIRTAMAMGVDNGILINDPKALECDSLGTAKILSETIKKMDYDLIIAGQRAVDDDSYVVGPAVAQYLDIPCITLVSQQKISDKKIECERTIDGGMEVVEASLPALLTTQRGLNEPRYTSLPGIMKAKKKKIDTRTLADMEIPSPGEANSETLGLKFPSQKRKSHLIEGNSPEEKVDLLLKALQEAHFI